MDRLVIEEKLESLRRCVERARGRCPESVATLAAAIESFSGGTGDESS